MPLTNKPEKIPKQMQPIFDTITSLTDEVCRTSLNEEYAELASQMIAALCRKRPSPLASGRSNAWACGVLFALGFVNFLFDKSSAPHMSATDLCSAFCVSKSTGSAKGKVIRDIFNIMQCDPNWCLPSQLDSNPIAWMIQVNGLMVDARMMPREIQENAYRKGLIPYLPTKVAKAKD